MRQKSENVRKGWNINQLFHRLRLAASPKARLTPHRSSLWGNPWAYGGKDSHFPLCYLCQYSHSSALHRSSRIRLHGTPDAPLPCNASLPLGEFKNQISNIKMKEGRPATAGLHNFDFWILHFELNAER